MFISSWLAVAAENDYIYLQKNSTGKTVERTVTLTPNSTMTVNETGQVKVSENKYPVIQIPLSSLEAFNDFEMKASSVNFTTDTAGDDFYWYHSPSPAIVEFLQGVLPDVYFTDSGATRDPSTYPYDRRSWIKQDSRSIFQMKADGNSSIGNIIIVLKDNNGFFARHRGKLVFSYCLMSGATYEKDPANRIIWRTVVPTEWVGDDYQPGQDHLPTVLPH